MDRDYRPGYGGQNYDGGYRRDARKRRPVIDYGSTMVQWLQGMPPSGLRQAMLSGIERPSPSYVVNIQPSMASLPSAAESITCKYLHESTNKVKHSVNMVRWTPDGRRLLAGSSSGEFTLWNGTAFNFETIMQAHYGAVRAATWSRSEEWLISSDSNGVVKYWQPNFNNVKQIDKLHADDIRDLAFSPNDSKFVTACDDAVLKIVDFASSLPESSLTGHNWDVKTVDWHPNKGLLVSGSKDHQIKLWDPRNGRCLTTLHGHKNTVSKVAFEPRKGQLLATCARDHTARIFDIRMMRDICLLRGHEKDVSTVAWHPFHANLLSTGGSDGSLFHYLLDEPHTPAGMASGLPPYDAPDPNNTLAQIVYPAHRIQYAHEEPIWSLDWHPLGHILASGSNDRCTRFWSRARPGETDCYNDKYHLGRAAAEAQGIWDRRDGRRAMREEEEQEIDDEADGLVDQQMPAQQLTIPGIPGLTMNSITAKTTTVSNGTNLQLPTIPPSFDPNKLPLPQDITGMDRDKFEAMIKEGKLVIPPPFGANGPGLPPPPPLPANFDYTKLPPGTFPPPVFGANGQPLLPIPPIHHQPSESQTTLMNAVRLPGFGLESGAGGVRRRAPLPSQQESLAEEQRKGKYRVAR